MELDKFRLPTNLKFPVYDVPRFWVQTGACAVGVYQALFPRREGPGDEATNAYARLMSYSNDLYQTIAVKMGRSELSFKRTYEKVVCQLSSVQMGEISCRFNELYAKAGVQKVASRSPST